MTKRINRLVFAVLAGGLLVGLTSQADASTTYTYSTDSTSDAAGTTTTAAAVSKAAASQTASLVGKRIGAVMSRGMGGGRSMGGNGASGSMGGPNTVPQQESMNLENGYIWGEAAGGVMDGVSVWSNVTWSGMEDSTASTAFDGDIISGVVGVDKRIGDQFLAGLGLTFEGQMIDTNFNLGEQNAFGFGVAPYAAYQFNEMFGVNGMLGYTRIWGEQERRAGGVSSGALITSDYDSHRLFANINGTVTYTIDQITVMGNTGFLISEETTESFTESDGTHVGESTAHVGTLNVGGQVGYGIDVTSDTMIEPYISFNYDHDVMHEDVRVGAGQVEAANDADQFTIGYGVNLFSAGGITGSVEGSHVLGRENYDQSSVSATMRVSF